MIPKVQFHVFIEPLKPIFQCDKFLPYVMQEVTNAMVPTLHEGGSLKSEGFLRRFRMSDK